MTGKRFDNANVVTIRTNVSDRLGQLRESSENWKNRIEEKDAAKYTVAVKATDFPAELAFQKSEDRSAVRMSIFQSTSRIVNIETSTSSSNESIADKLSTNESEKRNGSTSRSSAPVHLDEEKLFDSFFAKREKRNTDLPVSTMDWDLDAITSTER